jgi:hypothetical protein
VIRDDHPWRGQGAPVAGVPTPEQVAEQIWGLYRFVPGTGPGADPVRGVPGADPTGRTAPTGGLPVSEELPFTLELNRPPSWSAGISTAGGVPWTRCFDCGWSATGTAGLRGSCRVRCRS